MPKPQLIRRCDPVIVQSIWNQVEYIRVQKQSTLGDRILKSVAKTSNLSEEEAQRRLDQAEEDGLLEQYTWVVGKGKSAGETMMGYKVPDFQKCAEMKKGSHDWYCFVCHKPGEVLRCSDCFRVYHVRCLESPPSPDSSDFTCPTCDLQPKCDYKRKQIRKLLEFATHRLRGKPLWKDLSRIGYLDDIGRNELLLYKYLDLSILHRKIKDGRYRSLEAFLIDVKTLVHDVCIIYGDLSNMADLSRVLLREIETELKEIRLCTNCYINAKARPSDWVSKPCKPPHDLIWAKLRGFPFWPAKVLEERDEGYEVRFFGAYHERGFVSKDTIRPYDIPPEELGVRINAGFLRAKTEVEKLQGLVNAGYYTSSSGESDMPDSDQEWDDEQYFQDSLKPPGKKTPKAAAANSTSNGTAAAPPPPPPPAKPAPVAGKKRKSKTTAKGRHSLDSKLPKLKVTNDVKPEPLKRPRRDAVLRVERWGEMSDEEEDEEEEEVVPEVKPKVERKLEVSLPPPAVSKRAARSASTGSGGGGGGGGGGRRGRGRPAGNKKVTAANSSTSPGAKTTTPSKGRGGKKTRNTRADLSSTDASGSSTEEEDVTSSEHGLRTPDSCMVTSSVEQPALRLGTTKSQVSVAQQTTPVPAVKQRCDCRDKYEKQLEDAAVAAKKEKAVLETRLEEETSKKEVQQAKEAANKTREELDKQEQTLRAEFQRELDQVMQQHREAVAHTKRRQWCYNCLEEAMYHCCWNTSYCSIKCQQEHWHKEHKRVCRRKR